MTIILAWWQWAKLAGAISLIGLLVAQVIAKVETIAGNLWDCVEWYTIDNGGVITR